MEKTYTERNKNNYASLPYETKIETEQALRPKESVSEFPSATQDPPANANPQNPPPLQPVNALRWIF